MHRCRRRRRVAAAGRAGGDAVHHDRGADRHDVDRPDRPGAAGAGGQLHRRRRPSRPAGTASVTFAFGVANFFGAPVLGALSDRYGRRPVLLLGFCGLALNFFVTALATALWMLIAVRLVGGAMQANAAVANAYVADITPPEERAKRFGLLGAMFGIGFILGPVMGGLLGRHRPAPAVLRRRRAGAGQPGSTAASCCPSRCRPSGAAPFEWQRANPVAALQGAGAAAAASARWWR
ncbi:MAG: MFS transporter [Comamonadaceae bacterium]|nr:MFS transporter [Comamonadaceae bacterium]